MVGWRVLEGLGRWGLRGFRGVVGVAERSVED